MRLGCGSVHVVSCELGRRSLRQVHCGLRERLHEGRPRTNQIRACHVVRGNIGSHADVLDIWRRWKFRARHDGPSVYQRQGNRAFAFSKRGAVELGDAAAGTRRAHAEERTSMIVLHDVSEYFARRQREFVNQISFAGVFREFILHSIGSAIGLPSIVIAALMLSWSFRRAEGWRSIQTVTLLIALGMLVALLSIIVDVGMAGLQQRVFFSLVLLWLSVVVHRLARLTGSKLNAVA